MGSQENIQQYRKEIDRLDDEILRLLNERSKNVIEIGKLKKQSGAEANLHTPAREAEIVERLTRQNRGPFPNDAIRSVYREVMSASLSLEGPQKVAYLGPRATFTHLACIQKFGQSAQYIPVNSITDVFNEVERGRANFGVVPIENSTEGVVNHTLDMFIDSSLLIYGEVLQEVSHNLLSKADRLEDIKTIHSHPHAIAQCRHWLETNLPHVPLRGPQHGAGRGTVRRRSDGGGDRLRPGRPALQPQSSQVEDRGQHQQLYPVSGPVAETTRAHRQGQDLDHAVREGQSRSAVRAAAPLCLTRDQHDQDRVPSFPP